MAKLDQLIPKKDVKTMETVKKNVPKHSNERTLFHNLTQRVALQGNLVAETDGFFIKKIRLSIPTKSTTPSDTPYVMHIWAKPFVRDNRWLMLKIIEPKILAGYVERASNIFGDTINNL
jgi:hypothetical protein